MVDQFSEQLIKKLELKPDWVSSWSSSAAGAYHGGRASLAYLQGHLDDEAVHVVMG
jgi:hypothetical protein